MPHAGGYEDGRVSSSSAKTRKKSTEVKWMFQILQLGDGWGSIENRVPAALFVQTLPHLVIEASGSYNTVPPKQ